MEALLSMRYTNKKHISFKIWRLTVRLFTQKAPSSLLKTRVFGLSFTWETSKWVAAQKRIRKAVAKRVAEDKAKNDTIATIERIKENCNKIANHRVANRK
jgi:hypothetical protein